MPRPPASRPPWSPMAGAPAGRAEPWPRHAPRRRPSRLRFSGEASAPSMWAWPSSPCPRGPTAPPCSSSTGARLPPGDRDLGLLVARLEDDPDDPIGARVAAANSQAVERILGARPMLVDIARAGDTLPRLGPRHILHA